jgi:hypothetical protein
MQKRYLILITTLCVEVLGERNEKQTNKQKKQHQNVWHLVVIWPIWFAVTHENRVTEMISNSILYI